MNNREKTREELLLEIENLQQEINVIKAKYQNSNSSFEGEDKTQEILRYKPSLLEIEQEDLIQSEERAKRQRSAIASIATDKSITEGDVLSAFGAITSLLSETMNVERASIWLLNDNFSELKCISLYESSQKKQTSGHLLIASDYPTYFKAIIDESRIYAYNAQTDPRTIEFTKNYLIPLGITSMLDAGITLDNKLVGVVCFEHTGSQRKWKADEEAFASTVAAMIAQIMSNQSRRLAEQNLRDNEIKLKAQNEEYLALNEELNQANDEFRRLMAELADSNQRNSAMLAANPDLMFVFNQNGVFIDYYAPNFVNLLLRPEEFLNKSSYDVLPPNLAEINRKAIDSLFEIGQPQNYGYELEIDGKIFTYDARMVKYGHNKAMSIVRDISNRKRVEEDLHKSEELHRKLLQTVPDIIIRTDIEGNITYANDQLFTFLGNVPKERIYGKNMLSFIAEKDLACAFENTKLMFISPLGVKEYQLKFEGKTIIDAEVNGDVIRDRSNNPLGMVYVIRDITQRKQAEQALLESQNLLNRTQSMAKIGGWEWDLVAQTMKWTDEVYRIHELDPENIARLSPDHIEIGLKCYDEEKRHLIIDAFQRCVEQGQPYDLELPFTTVTGKKLWVRTAGWPQFDGEKVVKVSGHIMDISERKLSEEKSNEKSRFIQSLLKAIPVAVFFKDRDGRYFGCNDAFTEIMGVTSEDISGKTVFELWPSENAMTYHKKDLDLMEKKQYQVYEYHVKDKNGAYRPVIFAKDILIDSNGKVAGLVGAFLDISERKQMEESLRKSEAIYRNLVERMPDGVYKSTHDGRFVDINPALVKMLGYDSKEELMAIEIKSQLYFDPNDRESLILKEKPDGIEVYHLRKKNGEGIWVEDNRWYIFDEKGDILFHEGIVRDITKRKQTESELILAKETAEINSANVTAIIEGTVDNIWAFNRNYEIIYINRVFQNEFYQTFGIRLEPGVNLIDSLPETIRPFWKLRYDRALNNEQFIVEDAIDTGNSTIYIQVSFNPIIKKGHVIGGSCFGSNITQRKLAEMELIKAKEKAEENERRYHSLHTLFRLMADTMPDMIWAKDLENKYIFTNKAFCQKLLNAKDTLEPIGKTDLFFAQRERNAHPKNREWHTFGEICADTDTITINQMKEMQFDEYGNVKGKFVFLDVHKAPLFDSEGKLIGVVGSARDITARKQSEEALIESEKKFKTIIETSPDAIAIASIDGIIQFVTANAIHLWGYEKEDELYGKNVMELIHPSYREKALYFISEMVKGNLTGVAEYLMLRKDGSNFYVEANADMLRDANNNPLGILYVVRDITTRKQAEKTLIFQSNMQEILMNIASKYINIPLREVDSAIQKSLEELGRFVNIDRVYVFDYEWDNDICKNTYEWCEDGIEPMINELQEVPLKMMSMCVEAHKKGEEHFITDVIALPEDDGARQILEPQGIKSLITIPMMNENQCIGYVGFDAVKKHHVFTEKEKALLTIFAELLVNIHNRKLLELNLIKAKEKAEESDRLKSAFLANMSHEIRTPMNAILGFADLLKKPNLSGDSRQEYIEIIKKSGDRMLNIIDEIVDISRIEAGLMAVNIIVSNINEQIENVYALLKLEAEKKDIKFTYHHPISTNKAIVKTDHEKLYAVLINLVKNAIKYTDKGKIEFGYVVKKVNEFAELEFYVKDTGIGIPVDRLHAIFDRFVQADIEDRQARQGAGLGLSISKAFVEILGGKIWVESKEGLGSTFYFTLPVNHRDFMEENGQTENLVHLSNTPIKKLKILIAEDDESSEMLIEIAIGDLASQILKAYTGIEAVEIVRKNLDIDLVLMDIQMPGLNGYKATRLIREFNQRVIIIAQTAYALSGDKERAIESGCDDYIANPINKFELMALIQKYFH